MWDLVKIKNKLNTFLSQAGKKNRANSQSKLNKIQTPTM